MKVLLLHPEDQLPTAQSQEWDLIVDLARAPAATYETWAKQAGCRVVSLADYANGFADLHRLKQTVPHGKGLVVDKLGIDWWDVILPMLNPGLEQACMLMGLAKEIGDTVELFSSRPDLRASALQKFLGIEQLTIVGRSSSFFRRVRHYREAFSHLDLEQLTQIAQDKFDPQHAIRRRLSWKKSTGKYPVFLLPTAYINISRTAVSYASLLPEEKFLLVVARRGGKLAQLPANVRMVSLDSYFVETDKTELTGLTEKLKTLQSRLVDVAPEFRMAEVSGIFQQGLTLLRWGLAARDAWAQFFESERVAGCLSADDVNPYTSLPLLLSRQRGIPTLAVHHGALDSRMAYKPLLADSYLAKGELESDYLLKACQVHPSTIVVGSPPHVSPEPITTEKKPWLVFFTEPYGTSGWRVGNVYEDLLPRLYTLAGQCGLKLVFKLHPFESIKGHKKLVSGILSRDQCESLKWIAGPITPELWNNIRFGMTVESTVALECATRQIPVFLYAWLQSAYTGYVEQYAKFGIGHILNSSNEIQNVPQLLANWKPCKSATAGKIWQAMEPSELRNLLTGNSHKLSMPDQTGVPAAHNIR